MIDAADRVLQAQLVEMMSDALYRGLLCGDGHVQKWALRAHRLAEHTSTIYGPAVALALLDQARADADARTVRYLAA